MSFEDGEILQLTPDLLKNVVLVDTNEMQLLRARNNMAILVANMNIRHIDMANRCHIVRQEVASAGRIGYVGRTGKAISYAFGGNSLVPEEQQFWEDSVQTQVTIDLLEGLLKQLGKSGVYLMTRSR